MRAGSVKITWRHLREGAAWCGVGNFLFQMWKQNNCLDNGDVCWHNGGVLTVAEVGLGPRREDHLAVRLAALGEGERERGRAADDLPRGRNELCKMRAYKNSDGDLEEKNI